MGHDADHCICFAIHLRGLSHCRRICGEELLPGFVAEQNNRGRAGLIIGGTRKTSQQGLGGEHIERSCRIRRGQIAGQARPHG